MFRQTIRAARIARPTARLFSTSNILRNSAPKPFKTAENLAEVETKYDLIGKGAQPGEVPTDLQQATGLERFELLGKLEGVEVFETEPLDASKIGTMADPVLIDSYDDYRYVGCTGSPAGSHVVMWLKPTQEKVARCWECGSVYKLNYLGTGEESHH
jgi:cytochrome c oxidase subunit 5b